MWNLKYDTDTSTYKTATKSRTQRTDLRLLKKRTSRCISWIQKRQMNRRSIANIRWIIETAREFQRNIYFCFIDYTKAFDYVDHNKLQKVLKDVGITDHLTCILRNLYAGQESTARTGHGTTDEKQQLKLDMEQQTGSKLGKEQVKAVYCHSTYLTYMQSTS